MRAERFVTAAVLAFAGINVSASVVGGLDLSSGSVGLFNTPIVGIFSDTYTFSIIQSVVANGSITSAVNGTQDVDFTSISLSGPSGLIGYSQRLGNPTEVWALPETGATLSPGSYTLTVAGTNSAGGGSYGGDFAVSGLSGNGGGGGGVGGALGLLDLSSGSSGFSSTPTAGLFTNTFNFTLIQQGIINGSISSVVNGSQNVDFSSIVISGPGGTANFSMIFMDPLEVWALPSAGTALGPGSYTLTLSGTNSSGVGSFGGNLAISAGNAATVSEPESATLVLVGLAAVGIFARRRKQRQIEYNFFI